MNKKTIFFVMFFKVWIHPRKTLREILKIKSSIFVWKWVFVCQFISGFESSYYFPFLHHALFLVAPLVFVCSFVWYLIGYFYFVFGGYLFGKKIGGKGSVDDLKAATVWCAPPAIVGLFLVILQGLPFWRRIIMGETSGAALMAIQPELWQLILALLYFVLIFWMMILWVINISEVHRFSVWKAVLISFILNFPYLWLTFTIGKYFYDISRNSF